jgi:hypothetical protein
MRSMVSAGLLNYMYIRSAFVPSFLISTAHLSGFTLANARLVIHTSMITIAWYFEVVL